MKKLSFLLLSLLVVSMLTGCKKDDPVNTQTVNMVINSRAIQDGEVTFSQSTFQFLLDYTNMTLDMTGYYKDASGQSQSLNKTAIKLTNKNNLIYSFGSNDPNSPTGYIDMSTGVIWFHFAHNSTTQVYCSYYPMYAYMTTKISNPDNGFVYNHERSAYMFVLDARGETCEMHISNFAPNVTGTIMQGEISYKNLKAEPTNWGYKITANEAESSVKGNYTITDLNINLNDQGLIIDGSFKCADLEFNLTGKMFALD